MTPEEPVEEDRIYLGRVENLPGQEFGYDGTLDLRFGRVTGFGGNITPLLHPRAKCGPFVGGGKGVIFVNFETLDDLSKFSELKVYDNFERIYRMFKDVAKSDDKLNSFTWKSAFAFSSKRFLLQQQATSIVNKIGAAYFKPGRHTITFCGDDEGTAYITGPCNLERVEWFLDNDSIDYSGKPTPPTP